MIVHDPHNPRAIDAREALEAHLPESPDDLMLVLGGDGFLLQTVATHGLDATYLGLNAGTLGFLLNDVTDWATIADAVRARRWTVRRFPLLEVHVLDEEGHATSDVALNDIIVERARGQTARLRLSIDGQVVVEKLVADGLIFSSALGSTAYTFSAGGPACHPDVRMMSVTAICPHHPRLSPIVLPPGAKAQVEVHQARWRPVRVVADGRGIAGAHRIEVGYGDATVHLAYLEGHDFTAQMIKKILRP